MDKYLSIEQQKTLLKNAPANLDKGKIVKSWVDQGIKLEGFNDQPAPVAEPKKTVAGTLLSPTIEGVKGLGQLYGGGEQGIANKLKNDVQSGAQDIQQGTAKGGTGGALQAVKGVAKAGLRTAGDVAGAIYAPVGAAIGATGIGKLTDTVGNAIANSPLGNAITDNSTVQNFAMAHPNAGEDFGRAANLITAGMDSGTIDPKTAIARTKVQVNNALDSFTPTAESQATAARSSFQSNLDKALPPLKNDVRNLPARYSKAETAFKDIVQNKDSIGLVDDAGNPRLPKDFTETVQAQQARLKDIYKGYTSKLSEVDAPKFEADITSKIQSKIQDVSNQLAKENSLDGQTALAKIQKELSGLRDTSPEGIQKYIESIGQRAKTAPNAPMTIEQAQLANLAGDMKNILDDSISKLDGPGYSELRAKYAAHKSLEDQLLRASAKEMRDTPGLMEKASNVGLTVEGLNYLLTQNPAAIVTGLGFKGATAFAKWLKSPTRALKNAFSDVERGYLSDVSPQTTIPTATNPNMNAISKTVTPKVPKSKGFIQSSVDNLKNPKNAQGGFIALPSTKVPEFMRPNEKLAMQNFIDHARLGKDISDSTFEIASKIAEKLGVSMDKTPKLIANVFEKYVSGQKKLSKPLFTK